MTDTAPDPIAAPTAAPRSLRGWLGDMPRWKKISLLSAGALVITGAVLMVIDPGGGTETAADGGTRNSLLETGLVPNQPGGGTGPLATSGVDEEPAAKGVFRLGFSFIAGFCLGSFVRATLKIAAIALGFWLAMTVILSYYGLVDVNWEGLASVWNHFASNVEAEWGSFQRFITGSLPAAGLVATGFAIGLKRH